MLNAKEITDDQAIKLAVKELHKINANPETRAHLEACDRYVRDMALTRGYAYNKGLKDRQPEVDAANKRADAAEAGQCKMIKNMISKGKTKDEIIDLTGITEEEYERIVK